MISFLNKKNEYEVQNINCFHSVKPNESEHGEVNPEDQIIRARNPNACIAYIFGTNNFETNWNMIFLNLCILPHIIVVFVCILGILGLVVLNPLCLLLIGIGYIIEKWLPPRVGSSSTCFWSVLIFFTLLLCVGFVSYIVWLPLALSPILNHNNQNGIASTTTTIASSLSNYNLTNVQWNSNYNHDFSLLRKLF